MGSTFIALPLTSGEAFLLRTADANGREWTILVDSGKKYGEGSRELAKLLAQVSPTIQRIDIAVCTHSDADHSQGFWHFADDWYDMGRTIGEFWLPGRWANAMPAILTDPTGFATKLAEGAWEASRKAEEHEQALEGLAKSREWRLNKLLFATDEGREGLPSAVLPLGEEGEGDEAPFGAQFGLLPEEVEMVRADLEETDDVVDPFDQSAKSFLAGPDGEIGFWKLAFDPIERAKLNRIKSAYNAAFAEVAETATAIRKIATAALARRIRVRWFDFGKYAERDRPSGGIKGLLEPLCAVEVRPDPSGAKGLSAFALFANLRLSRQNVESLVFYRPETDETPGVLFLGDSRLAHGIARPEKDFPVPFPKPTRRILVTAPHHGSDNNDWAFLVLKNWLGSDDPVFVRNGGQSNQSLGEFLRQSDRRCAQCVQCHGKEWNQWVAVSASGPNWNWPPSANACGTPRT